MSRKITLDEAIVESFDQPFKGWTNEEFVGFVVASIIRDYGTKISLDKDEVKNAAYRLLFPAQYL